MPAMKYQVTNHMHIRTAPMLEKNNIRGEVHPGYIFDAVEEVKGAPYTIPNSLKSSNDWLRDANNFYYWKGTTILYGTVPAPSLPAREWWFDFMQIERLWAELETKGEDVNVVVWDTGLDEARFGKKATDGYNLFDKSKNYNDMSYNRHGTEVARIIAADEGGIAPGCSLYVAKAYNGSTAIFDDNFVQSDIFKNADVINISYGFPKIDQWDTLITAMEANLKGQHTVCAAVGNNGYFKIPYNTYPSGFGSVIGISAINKDKTLYVESPVSDFIKICAPGSEIRSIHEPGENIQGTSFACAMVSGITALLIAYFKKKNLPYNHTIILKLLCDSCEPRSTTEKRWGKGILDTQLLLENIKKVPV